MAPRRPRLAPLKPDAFLRWAWMTGDCAKGTTPLTLEDVFFELGPRCDGMTLETLRRDYVRIAAKVRRNQRLGLEPFEGVC